MPVGTAATVKAMRPEEVRGHRRADRAGQHLPPDAAPGGGAGGPAGRPAPLHELARPDPDRFRRLPGDVAVAAAAHGPGRRDLPLASRRQRAPADPGAVDRDPAPARRHHHHGASTNARRSRRSRRSAASSMRPVDALGRSARATPSSPGPATASSASSRAACTPSCALESAAALTAIGFEGYAIGGLAVGEGQAADVRRARRHRAGAAGRPAALPDGRRQAGRPGRRGAARHRHVRLRAADPVRPHRPGLHPPRHGQPAQRPARRTTSGRWTRPAAAPPAAATAAPICTTWCAARRCWVRCC